MSGVTAVWSTKGGVGVSAVAAMLALGQVERGEEVLLVDLCGDMPALLGLDDSPGPGLADWTAIDDPTADALSRIELEARPSLRVITRGSGEFADVADLAMAVLASSRRHVIVDCGRLGIDPFVDTIAAQARNRIMVVRPCYLTLRSARDCAIEPTGVVIVREPRRVLGLGDVESVVTAPVVAQIAVDSSIARAIDAGLATARLPRRLVRMMAQVLTDAA